MLAQLKVSCARRIIYKCNKIKHNITKYLLYIIDTVTSTIQSTVDTTQKTAHSAFDTSKAFAVSAKGT